MHPPVESANHHRTLAVWAARTAAFVMSVDRILKEAFEFFLKPFASK
jgi:hypothetical protein